MTKCSETEARIRNFRLNNERGKINPIREAEFYRYLLDKGWSLHKIERELGIKRQRIQQILKRLKVTEEAKKILEKVPMPKEIQKKPKITALIFKTGRMICTDAGCGVQAVKSAKKVIG